MITTEDLVKEISIEDENNNFKLGEVVALFENDTAKIKFDGEEAPSEKQYAYIANYIPVTGDRVLLAVTGGTYIILGKINYNVSPDIEKEIDRYLFDLKKVTILKGLELTGALTANTGATVVGNVGVNGNINAVGLSATGAITGASANLSGGLILGGGTTVGGNAWVKGAGTFDQGINSNVDYWSYLKYLRVDHTLAHRGSAIGFFNRNPVGKTNINTLTGTPTTQGNFNAINVIVNALKAYGLF